MERVKDEVVQSMKEQQRVRLGLSDSKSSLDGWLDGFFCVDGWADGRYYGDVISTVA